MNYYKKELDIIKKSNRFRKRKIFKQNILDLASNDYLGLTKKKKHLQKTYKKLKQHNYYGPKSSALVNGYSKIHQKFEKKLTKLNRFEKGVVVGSGFLANLALIESMVRKNDILFIDKQYHASGMVAKNLIQGEVVEFEHNSFNDLEEKIIEKQSNKNYNRIIIAIEGIYSMYGDIAPKQFNTIASKYNAILIVDEAHSSGVIGKNLMGWFDYHKIKPKKNHIKMGTLGKAYGSYGAYILGSKEIISYLENRAKTIIYSTAPSLFDIELAHTNLNYINKNSKKISKKISKYQKLVKNILGIKIDGLILPINIGNNKKVIDIQRSLLQNNYLVGAIRQPTVNKAILRIILKLDIKKSKIKNLLKIIKKGKYE